MTGPTPTQRAARGRLRPVPDPNRQPPHNVEAEEAVLGAVLTAGRLLVDVAAVLEEADFYRPAHRAIWRAMLRLADRGEPTDPVTVLGELDHTDELADVGGASFLHTLLEAVPTVANAAHYAQLVADTARRRRVIDLGIRLAHAGADPDVLAHLVGELADTTRLDGRDWTPPSPVGVVGNLPVFPVDVLPNWLGEYVSAVATATQTHRIWRACSPSLSWPPWPPVPSRSSRGQAGASHCACSWPWAWTPAPARAAFSPPSPVR